MTIQTSRFGSITVLEKDLIHFEEGLLGFTELRQFVLLDDPEDDIFIWLQSCENANLAFPVLEPELISAGYQIELSLRDKQLLDVDASSQCTCLSIITIPTDPTEMTANLKAPIIINRTKMKARQCVFQSNKLAIREPIFAKLQQRIVKDPSYRFKTDSVEMDIVHSLVSAPTL